MQSRRSLDGSLVGHLVVAKYEKTSQESPMLMFTIGGKSRKRGETRSLGKERRQKREKGRGVGGGGKVNLTKEVVFALGRVGAALALKRKEDKLHWKQLLVTLLYSG